MKSSIFKIIIFILFFTAVAILLITKSKTKEEEHISNNPKQVSTQIIQLPRLLELGSHKCVPCKMMMPILDTLRNVYNNQLSVEFIDVWENREAGNKYGIKSIPTQIFFDKHGKERFRHVGFWSREDIEAKFSELGISLEKNM